MLEKLIRSHTAPSVSFGSEGVSCNPTAWMLPLLLQDQFVNSGSGICTWSHKGVPIKDAVGIIIKMLGDVGFSVFSTCICPGTDQVYIKRDTPHSMAHLSATQSRVDFYVVSENEELVRKMIPIVTGLVSDEAHKGVIYALTKTVNKIGVTRMGAVGQNLVRSNYSDRVMRDVDHVMADMKSGAPCGRLVILSGLPGTGKTYLIRGIIGALTKVKFVMVPPYLVPSLSGPDLVAPLMNARSEMAYGPYGVEDNDLSDTPLVLILEDGDECLMKRASDNMSALSSLLNLSDGLLGTVLDLRIIVTTNAQKIDADAATERAGRLCRRIQVDSLDHNESLAALRGIMGGSCPVSTSPGVRTLAEIYKMAKELGRQRSK